MMKQDTIRSSTGLSPANADHSAVASNCSLTNKARQMKRKLQTSKGSPTVMDVPQSPQRKSAKDMSTASPAKKRNKLSLKGKASVLSSKSMDSPKEGSQAPEVTNTDDKKYQSLTPKKALQSAQAPCVAALHNLGNTCYLNSVVQILRFTPHFLDRVNVLAEEIAACHKERAFQDENNRKKDEEEGENEEPEEDEMLTWDLVRFLKETFDKMQRIEDEYRAGKTSFIAIRPYDLLSTIEKLNPMFSGGEQHDAHELLGCLMAYVQDAVIEVNKHRKNNLEKKSPPALESCKDPAVSDQTPPVSQHAPPTSSQAPPTSEQAPPTSLEAPPTSQQALPASQEAPPTSQQAPPTSQQAPPTTKQSPPTCDEIIEEHYQDENSGSLTASMQLDGTCDTKSPQGTAPKRGRPKKKVNQKENDENMISGDANVLNNSLEKSPKECAAKLNNAQTTITSMFNGNSNKRYGTSRVVKPNVADKTTVKKGPNSQFKPPTPCKTAQAAKKVVGGPKLKLQTEMDKSEVKDKEEKTKGKVEKKTANKRQRSKERPEPKKQTPKAEKAGKVVSKKKESQKEPVVKQEREKVVGKVRPFKGTEVKKEPTARKSTGGSKEGEEEEDIDNKDQMTSPELRAHAVSQGKNAAVKLQRLKMTNFFKKVEKVEEVVPELLVDQVDDCIQQLCHGVTALRTQCLECERSTERKESFQDISLPVRKTQSPSDSDAEDDENEDKENVSPTRWLLEAVSETERLQVDNKYFCEQCLSLVEAERSTNYTQLPPVLTLHLKRFAALSGLFGGFTKINDHVPIPAILPCFRDACRKKQCRDQTHRYSLYGVVTHTGHSLSSGHYVAYIKAPENHQHTKPSPVTKALTFGGGDGNSSTSKHLQKEGTSEPKIVGTLTPKTPKTDSNNAASNNSMTSEMFDGDANMADPNNNADDNNNLGVTMADQNQPMEIDAENSVPVPKKKRGSDSPAKGPQKRFFGTPLSPRRLTMKDSPKRVGVSSLAGGVVGEKGGAAGGTVWFECDDEYVTVLSQREMDRVLSPNGSTPYLLFYRQCLVDEDRK